MAPKINNMHFKQIYIYNDIKINTEPLRNSSVQTDVCTHLVYLSVVHRVCAFQCIIYTNIHNKLKDFSKKYISLALAYMFTYAYIL